MTVQKTPTFLRVGSIIGSSPSGVIPDEDTFLTSADQDAASQVGLLLPGGFSNADQVGGWGNRKYAMSFGSFNILSIEFSDTLSKTFQNSGVLHYFGNLNFPTYIYDNAQAPSEYAGSVSMDEFPFKYVVKQDANGNQWMDGLGMTFENKLLTQSFTATCVASGPDDPWVWIAEPAVITTPTVELTATTVDWSLPANANQQAVVETTEKYGPNEVWNSKWTYEFRTGWFAGGAIPIWYAVSAEVTVRKLLGYGGTDPGYSTPFDSKFFPAFPGDSSGQQPFYPTEITPPAVARN